MNQAKQFMSSVLLALALCVVAAAQDNERNSKAPAPPSFCKPCLWYSGDFDPNNPKSSGFSDEKDLAVSQSAVYVPFRVPRGKKWKVTGVFGIVLSSVNTINPQQADWSFSQGLREGHGGKVIASGTSPATVTMPGCNGNIAIYCLGIVVKGIDVRLKAGKYWMMVVPYCTNHSDSNCEAPARYYLANEEDDPKPLNHVGPKNILRDAFWNSKFFGAKFEALGPPVCADCDMFSAGLVGTSKSDDAKLGSQ